MDNNGVACISEYGLEVILRIGAPSGSIPTNVRWMAPEVLSAEGKRVPSGDDGKAVDVYSFAMIMFEVSPMLLLVNSRLSHPSPTGLVGDHPVPE